MTLAAYAIFDLGSASPHRDSDELKDADNLAFLAGQPADVRAAWVVRCRLMREVDALSETDRWELAELMRLWNRCEYMGGIPETGRCVPLIRSVARAWFPAECEGILRAGCSWSCWLDALAADYGRSLVPATLEQHDAMVLDVGGFFRLFPYLTPEQWEAIGAFGALDQAWNNVRDIAEDAAAGKCYFPADTLRDFGMNRDHVMSGRCVNWTGWELFMTWWLSEHIPTLRDDAQAFLSATDLHPSLAALRSSCLHRYARVERVLRGLDFDYRAFPAVYEAEVKRELGEMALGGGAKEIA